MATTTNRATEIAHAREVDGRIAAAWDVYWALKAPFDRIVKSKMQSEKYAVRYEKENRERWAADSRAEVEKAEAKLVELRPGLAAAMKTAQDMDKAEYAGWQRFFLVEHIHSSQHCSSFRATTRIGWLPELSGLTEAEAVAEKGAILCTICFPSAPVEFTRGVQDDTVCPGSGKTIPEASRKGMGGICPDCGRWATRASYWNVSFRKHKKPTA